jgi:hypothetical protein
VQQLYQENKINTSAAKNELDLNFKEIVVETNDVFEWWYQNKFRYPNFFQFFPIL